MAAGLGLPQPPRAHHNPINKPALGGGKGSNLLHQDKGPDDDKEGKAVYNDPDHDVRAAGLQGNETSH